MYLDHRISLVLQLLVLCLTGPGVESTENNVSSTENSLPKRVASLSKCPALLYYDSHDNDCKCIPYYGIKCYGETAALMLGFCTTYEENTALLSFSPCPYFATDGYDNMSDPDSILLPRNLFMLNDYMCTPMNRKGGVAMQ